MMSERCPSSDKGVFEALVSSNKQIGQPAASSSDESRKSRRFYRLRLEFSADAAKAFADFKPGQFAELDLSGTALPSPESIPEDLHDAAERNILLRRPFSFTDVTAKGDKTFADLLYRVVGPATLRMAALSAGDSLSVIGPLGNGFSIPDSKKTALLIVGGMGVPPLLHLAKHLTADSRATRFEVIAFAGAKTAKDLPFESRLDEISQQLGFSLPEFARYGIESVVATDDGTAGYHGLVTDCFTEWLGQADNLAAKDTVIYACGPQSMLARIAEIAKEKNIDCQLSMERTMACGIGLCQSCAVECYISPVRDQKEKVSNGVSSSNETVYKMCCKDGPVFNSKEVVFQ